MQELAKQNSEKTSLNGTPFVWKESTYKQSAYSKYKFIFYILIGLSSVAVAFGAADTGFKLPFLFIIAAIAIPLIVYSTANIYFGVYLTFVVSFFILGILRFIDLPLGLLMDFLILYYFLAMVIHIGRNNWTFAKNGVSTMVVIWIIYNLAQVANPVATSRLAWVFTIRGMAGAFVFFFICLYAFKTFKVVDTFISLWIFLAFLLGLYGLYQEFHGLSPFEINWIKADEERYKLYYNWGRYRKFSFFSDPTTFGMTAAYTALLCFILCIGPIKSLKRIYYLIVAGTMGLSMVFSGTRTAYVLIPIGIVFLTVLTLKPSFIFVSVLFFIAGAGVILSPIKSLGPLDANALERLRSAFMPENDPSFQVRMKNQAFIKPYIQSHPIGAGLGTVGDWGERFSPGSQLAGFPPDSGFVKIAVELGWIGMIIYCVLLFILFKIAIKNYHILRDPKLKTLQAALLSVIFCLIIANYAQEALTMYPTSIIFYASMAIVIVMPKLENHETENIPNTF